MVERFNKVMSIVNMVTLSHNVPQLNSVTNSTVRYQICKMPPPVRAGLVPKCTIIGQFGSKRIRWNLRQYNCQVLNQQSKRFVICMLIHINSSGALISLKVTGLKNIRLSVIFFCSRAMSYLSQRICKWKRPFK